MDLADIKRAEWDTVLTLTAMSLGAFLPVALVPWQDAQAQPRSAVHATCQNARGQSELGADHQGVTETACAPVAIARTVFGRALR